VNIIRFCVPNLELSKHFSAFSTAIVNIRSQGAISHFHYVVFVISHYSAFSPGNSSAMLQTKYIEHAMNQYGSVTQHNSTYYIATYDLF